MPPARAMHRRPHGDGHGLLRIAVPPDGAGEAIEKGAQRCILGLEDPASVLAQFGSRSSRGAGSVQATADSGVGPQDEPVS